MKPGKSKQRTFAVFENGKEIARTKTIRPTTHAVVCERGSDADAPYFGKKGETLVIRYSHSEESANRAVKEFTSSAWNGAWVNLRIIPVTEVIL